jgi:hypothetical protein
MCARSRLLHPTLALQPRSSTGRCVPPGQPALGCDAARPQVARVVQPASHTCTPTLGPVRERSLPRARARRAHPGARRLRRHRRRERLGLRDVVHWTERHRVPALDARELHRERGERTRGSVVSPRVPSPCTLFTMMSPGGRSLPRRSPIAHSTISSPTGSVRISYFLTWHRLTCTRSVPHARPTHAHPARRQ